MSALAITAEHWLTGGGVAHQPVGIGNPMPIRRLLLIHHTSGASGQSSIDFWRTPAADGASAHIVIERDGRIIQCRAFDRTCGHAGRSKWKDPKTGRIFEFLNACSIGIELANAGDSADALSWARRQPGTGTIRAAHRNGGPAREWETYPAAQLAACTALARLLVAHYNLDDVTGHDCVSPARKTDPGPAFPMQQLREACGFQGLPTVHR